MQWRVSTVLGKLLFLLVGIKIREGVKLYGRPIVSRADGSEIQIGARVVLCSSSTHTALGINHPVILRTLRPGARIIIGDDVGVSGGSICAAVEIFIGAETMLGANVTIADTDFHPLSPKRRRYSSDEAVAARIRIGKNVFIGANTIVLKGVEIGNDSVIGAGSVVTRSIPAGVIAAGNPCRIIRMLRVSAEASVTR
jgi:acetyltransferase-like isoleucine patch superfamily enzyme